ncbi:MAG: hypothetical protein V4620_13495 [Bacteroidota bacterium]
MKKSIFYLLVFLLATAFLSNTNQSLNTFLKAPFDLQKFKQKKGQSNSGGAYNKKYYLKPKVKGMYYSFFLFQPLIGYVYSHDGNKQIKDRKENGLEIVTYKPNGEYFESYFDPTETLIEVTARYNDYDLPELAFIGLDTLTIKNRLGTSFIAKSNCMLYYKNNCVLTLHIEKGMVDWLKYTRLKFNLKPSNIPEGILTDKNY